MPRISLPVIFALQTLMLVAAMVGIITSFVLVTNESIDAAVETAVSNKLGIVAERVRSLAVQVEPAAWMLKRVSYDVWGDDGAAYETALRPTPESYNRTFTAMLGVLEQNPRFSYVYQSVEMPSGVWADVSCGNITGQYSCTIANSSAWELYFEAPTVGRAFPLSYAVADAYTRDPTDDEYIVEIRNMRASARHNVTGLWGRVGAFFDAPSGQTLLLISFYVPQSFSPVDGRCTRAMSVDVSLDEIAEQLRVLATDRSFLYLVEVNTLALIATTLPASRMPLEVAGEAVTYTVPETADAETNAAMRRIIADAAGRGGLAAEDGSYVVVVGDVLVSYRHVRRGTLHWLVVDHTERDVYFGEPRRLTTTLVIVACLVVLACLLVSTVIYAAVVRPIVRMSEAMGRVSRLEPARAPRRTAEGVDADPSEPSPSIHSLSSEGPALSELRPMHDAFVRLDVALQSFTRYVPRNVVKELIDSNQLCRLEMLPRQCSMLFVDIAGFTTLSERVPADVLSRLIHVYFSRMSRIVMHHSGIIDKFIGDCVMAVWGAPLPLEHHELRAALCAMMIDREARTDPLARAFDEAGEQLRVRVGVNSGDVLAGNMGSDERMNYTVIGDHVNLAARLESFNKQMGTGVMLSEFTAQRLQGKVALRLLCRVSVVGKAQPVEVFEPVGVMPGSGDKLAAAELSVADTAMDASVSLRTLREREVALGQQASGGSFAPSECSHQSDFVRDHRASTLLHEARAVLEASSEAVERASAHTAAVRDYIDGRFGDALQALDKLRVQAGAEDRAAEIVRSECERQLERPDADFDGVYRAQEK